MKTSRILLSVVAIAFAIVSAFASQSGDIVQYGYKTIEDGQEVCNPTNTECPGGNSACFLNIPEDSSPAAVALFERSGSVCLQQGSMN